MENAKNAQVLLRCGHTNKKKKKEVKYEKLRLFRAGKKNNTLS